MADTKTTALTEITAPVSTDLVYVVGDPGTTPVSRKATLATLRKSLMVDGWIEAGSTWTYASADAPTFTFTISGDLTGKYSPGMRVKLTQTTVKYFIITAISYGAPNTTVTIYGGTDYTLTSAAISANYYSMSKAPFGFPLSPSKWMVLVTDTSQRTQGTPTQNQWYNLNSNAITIPIGVWVVSYAACVEVVDAPATAYIFIGTALSTANNSASDADLVCLCGVGHSSDYHDATVFTSKVLELASKTVYYFNVRTTQADVDTIIEQNAIKPLQLSAACAYL